MYELESRAEARKERRLKISPLMVGIALIAVLLIVIVILAVQLRSVAGITVPSAIASKANFPIHVPTRLPDQYKIAENSFSLTDNVLTYRAMNTVTGSTIAFTEQKKPQQFNFETFYKQNMADSKVIEGGHYQIVAGQNIAKDRTMLSVVTDQTWLMASTASPLSDADIKAIARGIKQY